MIRKEDYGLYVCVAVIALLVIGYSFELGLFENAGLGTVTGRVTTADAQTSADIATYFAINMSINLSTEGILFDVNVLPATDVNATANYDNLTGGGGNNGTRYYLTVELDSNVYVDFCIKANATLNYGSYYIGLGNYTFSNYTLTNETWPNIASNYPLTNETYLNSTKNVGRGNSSYYRFWLDVPGDQSPGVYVNRINFKGVQFNNAC